MSPAKRRPTKKSASKRSRAKPAPSERKTGKPPAKQPTARTRAAGPTGARKQKPAAGGQAKKKSNKRPSPTSRSARSPRARRAPASEPQALPATEAVPKLLLEGDESAEWADLPAKERRFLVVPKPPEEAGSAPAPGDAKAPGLPASYGTRILTLTARDPHWLFAFWDLLPEEQARCNRESRDRHLILRITTIPSGAAAEEVHVHPESTHWFVHVGRGSVTCEAELGYYNLQHEWQQIAKSGLASTPADRPSEDRAAHFATIPPGAPLPEVKAALAEALPEAAAAEEAAAEAEEMSDRMPAEEPLQASSEPPVPDPRQAPPQLKERTQPVDLKSEENESQTAARQVPGGEPAPPSPLHRPSLEKGISPGGPLQIRLEQAGEPPHPIPLVAQQFQMSPGPSSMEQLPEGLPGGGGAEGGGVGPSGGLQHGPGVSSLEGSQTRPGGGAGPAAEGVPPSFWFDVNAELVVYGRTVPGAVVTLGDRIIPLRPDGTFSFRFALPDGRYQLELQAFGPPGTDGRQAALAFQRHSSYGGVVGESPQDSQLKSPPKA